MKVEKFKVLLYLKKSGLDKNGKAPIMGRITLNRTMAQFGCKLSCTPKLWNPRESRLDGKSKEAVEVNAKIDKLLLAINSAYESLVERKTDFDAKAIKDLFQCSADTQMTLLKQLDAIIADIESRIGIDYKKGTLPNYQYTRLTLGLFVKKRYGTDDVAFGELDEQFIREYMDFCLDERGLALDTVRHYLAILKKTCPYFLKTFSRGVFLILFRIGIYLCNNKQIIDKTKMIMISLKRIFCTCCLLLSVWAVFAQGPSEWKALEKPLNFYLANDLGRNGYYDQKPIAELMGQMAENVDIEAVVAAGDVHHFEGVRSVDDPLDRKSVV